MSFIKTIKIPLWDGNDTSVLQGVRTFEAIDDEIELKSIVDQIALNQSYTLTPSPHPSYPDTSGTELTDADLASDDFLNSNWVAWQANPDIRVDLGSQKNVHKFQILVLDDPTIDAEEPSAVAVYGSNNDIDYTFIGNATSGDTVGSKRVWWTYENNYVTYRYIKFSVTKSTLWAFVCEVEVYTPVYTPTSPSPVVIWTSLPIGSSVDMSTIRILPFKDDVMQTATSTDIKFKYAINNGALNASWLTQADLRLEDLSEIPITDATNSFKILGQYKSDGNYKSASSAYALVNVEFPDAGDGGVSRARIVNSGGI